MNDSFRKIAIGAGVAAVLALGLAAVSTAQDKSTAAPVSAAPVSASPVSPAKASPVVTPPSTPIPEARSRSKGSQDMVLSSGGSSKKRRPQAGPEEPFADYRLAVRHYIGFVRRQEIMGEERYGPLVTKSLKELEAIKTEDKLVVSGGMLTLVRAYLDDSEKLPEALRNHLAATAAAPPRAAPKAWSKLEDRDVASYTPLPSEMQVRVTKELTPLPKDFEVGLLSASVVLYDRRTNLIVDSAAIK